MNLVRCILPLLLVWAGLAPAESAWRLAVAGALRGAQEVA